jgi:Flp pilus assembly protein TadG
MSALRFGAVSAWSARARFAVHTRFAARFSGEHGKRGDQRERGSMAVITVMWSFVVLLLAGLVIDGGLAISQRERAADLADQAARAEAQNIDQGTLRNSGAAEIADDGCGRAQVYLASAADSIHYGKAELDTGYGDNGCALSAAAPGNSVTVSVRLTYAPFVFDLFGGTITVTETGTATAATGD